MSDLSGYGLLGLCIGFLWGIGCSLAILYSIYLGGYRKGVEDSLADVKPRRFVEAMKKIRNRREKRAQSVREPAKPLS